MVDYHIMVSVRYIETLQYACEEDGEDEEGAGGKEGEEGEERARGRGWGISGTKYYGACATDVCEDRPHHKMECAGHALEII
jgi:hypothetical protein